MSRFGTAWGCGLLDDRNNVRTEAPTSHYCGAGAFLLIYCGAYCNTASSAEVTGEERELPFIRAVIEHI